MKKFFILSFLLLLFLYSFKLYSQNLLESGFKITATEKNIIQAINNNDTIDIISKGKEYLPTVYTNKKISVKEKYKIYKNIMPHIYGIIDSIVNLTQRKSYFKGMSDIYFNYINICYTLYDKTRDKKYSKEAFTFIEQYKNLSLLDNNKPQNIELKNIPTDSLIKREANLYANTFLMDGMNNYGKRDSFYNLTNKFYKSLEEEYPEYFKFKQAIRKFDFTDLHKNIKKNTLIIEFIRINEEYFRFVVSKDNILFDKIKAKSFDVDNEINIFINSLQSDNYYEFYKSSHKLYNLLFSDIFHICKNKEIIVVPDGDINFLPFEALLKDTLQKKNKDYQKLNYLIKNDCIFSYEISAKNYINNLKKDNKHNNKNSDIDFFAPIFENYKETECKVSTLINTKYFSEILTEKYESNIFLNEDATSEMFIKRLLSRSNILHVATHSEIKNDNSMLSFILFNNSDTINNCPDSLFLRDIYCSVSYANLIIVESCGSGKGKYTLNEGIMNFAYGFNVSGTSSVVYTLWKIDETVTNEILIYFYDELSKNKNKSLALHNAKLNFINNYAKEELSNPVFWAGIVVSGDVRPVKIKMLKNNINFLYIIIFFVVIFIFISGLLFLRLKKRKSRI